MKKIQSDIIDVLKKWAEPIGFCSEFDAMWYGYNTLSDETGYALPELKAAMKVLREHGKVELKPTYDTDFILCGCGWFLNE